MPKPALRSPHDAAAGTGKTRTVIARTCAVIKAGAHPQGVLLMSFTNKCVDEIKEVCSIFRGTSSEAALVLSPARIYLDMVGYCTDNGRKSIYPYLK
jgi:superfamily I DNA/RNA helicase